MKSIALIVVAAVAAFIGSSCETTAPVTPPPGGHDGHGHGHDQPEDHKPLPSTSWDLHSAGVGYDLDLSVGGEESHVATGGEYMRGRSVSRSSRNVPSGTVSAYEVLLPDGEIDLYWVEEGRPGSLLVYRKSYDAMDDRWSSERRLRTINY